jgi:hypothetical protein
MQARHELQMCQSRQTAGHAGTTAKQQQYIVIDAWPPLLARHGSLVVPLKALQPASLNRRPPADAPPVAWHKAEHTAGEGSGAGGAFPRFSVSADGASVGKKMSSRDLKKWPKQLRSGVYVNTHLKAAGYCSLRMSTMTGSHCLPPAEQVFCSTEVPRPRSCVTRTA